MALSAARKTAKRKWKTLKRNEKITCQNNNGKRGAFVCHTNFSTTAAHPSRARCRFLNPHHTSSKPQIKHGTIFNTILLLSTYYNLTLERCLSTYTDFG